MKCKTVARMMSDYIDGNMPGHDRLDFELHIEKCDRCAKSLAAVESMLLTLRGMGSQESPVKCWSEVRNQISNRHQAPAHWYGFLLRPLVAVPALGLPVLAYVIFALPAVLNQPQVKEPANLISAPEYSRYLTAHSHAQRAEVLSDPDVALVAAELEKASLAGDTVK